MKTILRDRLSTKELNTDINEHINLVSKVKQITNASDEASIDVNEIYTGELNSSKKYRLIFNINPICSNVLFNAVTEVVYNEGKKEMALFPIGSGSTEFTRFITGNTGYNITSEEPITPVQCIRDTEYSNPLCGGFSYHPGVDIFNNHILRQNGFVNIRPRTKSEGKTEKLYTQTNNSGGAGNPVSVDPFNTILDFQRNDSGDVMNVVSPGPDYTYSTTTKYKKHNYQVETINSFEETLENELVEKDGWFGFYNKSTLNIPGGKSTSGENIYINKVLNGSENKSGDFIDMFPDRTRFSFSPHMNIHQGNRMEKNWDYCLTYPYKSDKENEIVFDSEWGINGLKFVYVTGYTTDSGKNRIMLLSTGCKHNLLPNSEVRLWVGDKHVDAQVKGIGNFDNEMTDYYFSVDADNIPMDLSTGGRFAKLIFSKPCEYYFRIFRRIPNFRDAGGYSEDSTDMINAYGGIEHEFDSEINKLAFANTVYGDDVVQIIYTDDIDLTGLVDNLGRPLTDIFLTIIKRNAGHNEWYKMYYGSGNENGDKIEWSSCFGKVTSGLDIPAKKQFSIDYNVRRLHNISYSQLNGQCRLENAWDTKALCFSGDTGGTVQSIWKEDNSIPRPFEEDITISGNTFYGDLVEYSPLQVKETVIEEVFHRFNTLQREYVTSATSYADIICDDILADDYDAISRAPSGSDTPFICASKKMNSYFAPVYGIDRAFRIPGNLFPEGYFYKPHYKIHVADFNETIAQSSDRQIFVSGVSLVDSYLTFTTETSMPVAVELLILKDSEPYNDIVYADVVGVEYDKENKIWNIVSKIKSGTFDANAKYVFFIKTEGIPSYAQRYPDDSGRYLWRGITKFSDLTSESELYGMPFANGAHYIYKGFNFFLRRQDPDGESGMNVTEEKVAACGYKNKNKIYKITRSSKTRPELSSTLDYVKQTVFDIC